MINPLKVHSKVPDNAEFSRSDILLKNWVHYTVVNKIRCLQIEVYIAKKENVKIMHVLPCVSLNHAKPTASLTNRFR